MAEQFPEPVRRTMLFPRLRAGKRDRRHSGDCSQSTTVALARKAEPIKFAYAGWWISQGLYPPTALVMLREGGASSNRHVHGFRSSQRQTAADY